MAQICPRKMRERMIGTLGHVWTRLPIVIPFFFFLPSSFPFYFLLTFMVWKTILLLNALEYYLIEYVKNYFFTDK